MSAQEDPHPRSAQTSTEDDVSKIVLMFMASVGMRQNKELALALGWNDTKASRKLSGDTPWSLSDLDALAVVFECDRADFLRDPGEMAVRLRSRWLAQSGQVNGVPMPVGQMEFALGGDERALASVGH